MVAATSWESLAGGARSGDQRSVNALLRNLEPYLHKLARSLTGPDEDDLTQAALLAVWRGLDRYDPRRSFLQWARVVAKNAMLSVCRGHRQSGGFEDGCGFGVADRPPPDAPAADLPAWWVWEVMAGLDDRDRAAVGEWFGLVGKRAKTVTEIAAERGRARSRQSGQLADALACCRVSFEARYGGQPA